VYKEIPPPAREDPLERGPKLERVEEERGDWGGEEEGDCVE